MASELRGRKKQNDPEDDVMKEGKRVLEQLIKDGRERWEAQPEDTDFADKLELSREIQRYIQEIHEQLRLERDKALEPARLKLESLLTMYFRIRYGDYPAIYTSYLRQEARLLQPGKFDETMPATPVTIDEDAWRFFMSQNRSLINMRLQREGVESNGLRWPSDLRESGDAPLVHLLKVLAINAKQNILHVSKAIGAYVERISFAHNRLQRLAKKGKPFVLMAAIQTDLEDLADAPQECEEDVPAIKSAILTYAGQYFNEFEWDDEKQAITICTPNWDAFMIDDRGNLIFAIPFI
ncbi:hypothetical protein GGI43DRAFT_431438 [Trichoderma evansii]